MDKEEAIEYLKNLIKNPTISQDPFYTTKIAIDTVLNYIEELEKKNKGMLEVFELGKASSRERIEYDYIPKQKIRDKIEHLKSYKGLVMYEKYNYEAIIRHLEELLEEGE